MNDAVDEPMKKTFALIGVGGYIAPRHLRAIKDVGGILRAALDPANSVGIIDSYFSDARFFVEFERFDRYLDRCRRLDKPLDYVSICSPNYLHDAHVRFALRSGSDAICEKPLVLNPRNIDGLADIEQETGRKVHTILQLRLHPAIIELKNRIAADTRRLIHEVDLTYITSRGRWYYVSWKGDEAKSGGIATNIGVHFFDMLSFVFGSLRKTVVHHRAMDCARAISNTSKARVRWFLSINARDVPEERRRKAANLPLDHRRRRRTRVLRRLHGPAHARYREILAGRGFPLDDVRPSIETVAQIRALPIELNKGEQHPFLLKVRANDQRYQYGWPV